MREDNKPELRFTLRTLVNEEDAAEARRRMVAQILADFTPTADAIRAMHKTVAHIASIDFRVPDCSAVALAVAQIYEEAQRAGAMIGAAFAGLVEQMEESARLFGETIAAMPEEEREELRRALEDAPPEEVDVNANGAGVM